MNTNNKPKVKNLRALISSGTSVKKENSPPKVNLRESRESLDRELSFNITPDEEEIKKQIKSMSQSPQIKQSTSGVEMDKRNPTLLTDEDPFNYESLESEFSTKYLVNNQFPSSSQNKAKNEAKDLIERTKKIIDNMDNYTTSKQQLKAKTTRVDNKTFEKGTSQSSLVNIASITENFTQRSFNIADLKNEEEQVNILSQPVISNHKESTLKGEKKKAKTIEVKENEDFSEDSQVKEVKTKKHNDQDEEITLKNHITLNTNAVNQRLLEKIKQIRNLEKELKEKNQQIANLTNKVEKQREEIMRLNENILENNNKSWKVECMKLQDQIHKNSNETNAKQRALEDIVGTYKVQLENLLNLNDQTESKVKTLEKKLMATEKERDALETQSKNYKFNFESEMKEKNKQRVILNKVKTLLQKVAVLYKDNNLVKSQNQNFIDKIKYFFEPEREDTEGNTYTNQAQELEHSRKLHQHDYSHNESNQLVKNNPNKSNQSNNAQYLGNYQRVDVMQAKPLSRKQTNENKPTNNHNTDEYNREQIDSEEPEYGNEQEQEQDSNYLNNQYNEEFNDEQLGDEDFA